MKTRQSWSLRRRLLFGFTLLVAAIAVTNGALTITSSHTQLVARLDQQLTSAAERTADVLSRIPDRETMPPPSTARPPVTDLLPGQGAGAIGILFVDDEMIAAGYVGADGESHDLSDAQLSVLTEHSLAGSPQTVDLGGELGRYRVVRTEADGGRAVVINGLALADVEATTASLIANTAIVSAVGLLLAVFLGFLVLRVALRPLNRVAATATRVSQRPLGSKVSVPERVPVADTSATTEVGRVGLALNELLDSVESALVSREAGEQKLRRFIADASHELRTPLAVVRGYADLALRDVIDEPEAMRHPLQRIGAEAARMSSLVEDLLLLARLDEGRELRMTRTGLAMLVADAVADAHVAGPGHRWHLELPDDDLEVEIDADPERVHQVLANLLSNARTHTPAGTTVEVGLRSGSASVVLTVTDDGPGIPPNAVDELFERFSRVDESRARATGGSGLGLAIVRAIVDAHGGTVGVVSTPGFTRFTIELPRIAAHSERTG